MKRYDERIRCALIVTIRETNHEIDTYPLIRNQIAMPTTLVT